MTLGRPRQFRPLAWLIAGFLLAVLLGRIFPIEDDDVWTVDQQVSASAVIPQVVPADDATIASLQPGQPCTPLFPDGRWVSGELVVILDGKQQIRSITTTENPVVLGTSGSVLTCGHPFQIQTTVTGPYIQLNVENRGSEVFTVLPDQLQGSPYAYELAPLGEGE